MMLLPTSWQGAGVATSSCAGVVRQLPCDCMRTAGGSGGHNCPYRELDCLVCHVSGWSDCAHAMVGLTMSSARMQPWPPCSLSPHTQSNMNCTPSRWWGRNQRVNMGSTSTVFPPLLPAAAGAPSAPTAAAAASEDSQRIKGSMPGGRASGCGSA